MKRFFLALIFLTYTAAIALVAYQVGESGLLTPYLGGGAAAGTPAQHREAFRPFWEAFSLINRFYVDQPVDTSLLVEGALEGMLAALGDPNTVYSNPEQEALARSESAGEFQGIGAEVTSRDGQIVIVAPIEGSPAEKAGLLPGDILVMADNVTLEGMAVDEAVALVRGPAGSTVRLTIERDGVRFEVAIVRDVIPLVSVRSEMLEDNLAYIRISRFGLETNRELTRHLEEVMAQNPRGLILDLRNDPGGDRNTAVDVADQFLPQGVVLIQRYGDGSEETFTASDAGLAQDIPMVVLVNEGSASASELVAGALQDYGRATLIGVQTFGKGTVQTWQSLSNGGGVRITMARWLTPHGRWIHGVGLTPDLVVERPEEDPNAPDTQLEAARLFLLEEVAGETQP